MFIWIANYFSFPAAFFYVSSRMFLAAGTSLLLCLFLGPFCISMLKKLSCGQEISRKGAERLEDLHADKKGVPSMGGVLLVFSLSISMLMWMDWSCVYTWLLFLTTLSLALLGFCDDWLKIKKKNAKGISARTKFGLQMFLSIGIVLYLLFPVISNHFPGTLPIVKEKLIDDSQSSSIQNISLSQYARRLYIPFVKEGIQIESLLALSVLAFFMSCTIVGSSNAVNLTDGLDGLAPGLLFISSSFFALFAFLSNHLQIAHYLGFPYLEGAGEIAIYMSAFSGACLGFLWFNAYPASVIMGDTGSLSFGGALGLSALLLKREILLAVVGGIFVVETLSVCLQVISFRLRKKRIFLCSPLHHHFEYKGWPESRIVIRFWILGILLLLCACLSLKFQ